jgi:Sec-independent protein translocase protein TatA
MMKNDDIYTLYENHKSVVHVVALIAMLGIITLFIGPAINKMAKSSEKELDDFRSRYQEEKRKEEEEKRKEEEEKKQEELQKKAI